jgi:hypothetical protein
VGTIVHPKTGCTVGPVKQGWNDRFDGDFVVTQNITKAAYDQQYAAYQNYLQHGGSVPAGNFNTSGTFGRRIIIVPVISAPQASACNGSNCDWTVTDFIAFFLQAHTNGQGDVTAEFIGSVPITNGTYGGTPIPSLSLTQTVLYK